MIQSGLARRGVCRIGKPILQFFNEKQPKTGTTPRAVTQVEKLPKEIRIPVKTLLLFFLVWGGIAPSHGGEFTTNPDGNRIFQREIGEDEVSEYCWDCYPSPWTKHFREFLAHYLPSSLRTEHSESAFKHHVLNCAGGAGQVGVDIVASGTLLLGESAAYVFEALHPDKTMDLLRHRWDQVRYGFFYIFEGEIFAFMSDKFSQLARHIIRSVTEGDTYALCEMAVVAGTFFIGPKMKAEWAEDRERIRGPQIEESRKAQMEEMEQDSKTALLDLETAKRTLEDRKARAVQFETLTDNIGRQENSILRAREERDRWTVHISTLQRQREELTGLDDSVSKGKIESLDKRIANAVEKRNDLDQRRVEMNENLKNLQSRLEEGNFQSTLRTQVSLDSAEVKKRNQTLEETWRRQNDAQLIPYQETLRERAGRLKSQTVRAPQYAVHSVVKEFKETFPTTSMWEFSTTPFLKVLDKGSEITVFYGIGRFLHEPDEASLEDYLNALSVNSDSP